MVAEREGRIVAWASAGPYRSRPAYAGVAEHSVYVARSARGTGAGRAALEALCRAYAERGFWKLVSRIFPENIASLALHERCGFRVVGVYRRHGKLEGAWRDCVIVERMLDEARSRVTMRREVVAMCAAQACAQIGAFSVAALIPTLIPAWGLTNTEAGWISGIYYAAYTARGAAALVADRSGGRQAHLSRHRWR